MKGMLFLIVVAIVLFGGQAIYYGGKADAALKEAQALLPGKPDDAYAKMKPVFGYSNLTTFGKAGAVCEDFFRKLADSIIDPLRQVDKHDAAFFDSLYRAIVILDTAKKEHGKETEKHVVNILEAVNAEYERLSHTETLGAWDALLDKLGRLEKEGRIPASYAGTFSGWHVAMKAIDRRGVGMRDGAEAAQAEFAEGVKALALIPSEEGGPLLGALPKPVPDRDLIEAEKRFQNGEGIIAHMQRMFHEEGPPVELRPILCKLYINHVSMRVAHLIDLGIGRPRVSGYMAYLFSGSGGSDGEVYGSFTGTVAEQIRKAAATLNNPATKMPPEDLATLNALLQRMQSQFAQALGDRGRTETHSQAFRAAATQAGLSAAQQDDMRRMGATDQGFLVLR